MSLFTRTRPAIERGIWVTIAISAVLIGLVGAAGFFDRDPYTYYPAKGAAKPVLAVNFSGDMGMRFLLGASTSRGLTEHGVAVLGVTTPALFRRHRTRAEVDAIVADGVRAAIARAGGRKIVVQGQSYGADIVQTGMARLPAELRPHIAAIILILPGETAFFRADPTSLEYMRTPDSYAKDTINSLTWAPLTCIYGREETDSACPALTVPAARKVAMPGSHTIDHDEAGLLRHVLESIHAVAPEVPAR